MLTIDFSFYKFNLRQILDFSFESVRHRMCVAKNPTFTVNRIGVYG
jgi:hypothetical protein